MRGPSIRSSSTTLNAAVPGGVRGAIVPPRGAQRRAFSSPHPILSSRKNPLHYPAPGPPRPYPSTLHEALLSYRFPSFPALSLGENVSPPPSTVSFVPLPVTSSGTDESKYSGVGVEVEFKQAPVHEFLMDELERHLPRGPPTNKHVARVKDFNTFTRLAHYMIPRCQVTCEEPRSAIAFGSLVTAINGALYDPHSFAPGMQPPDPAPHWVWPSGGRGLATDWVCYHGANENEDVQGIVEWKRREHLPLSDFLALGRALRAGSFKIYTLESPRDSLRGNRRHLGSTPDLTPRTHIYQESEGHLTTQMKRALFRVRLSDIF